MRGAGGWDVVRAGRSIVLGLALLSRGDSERVFAAEVGAVSDGVAARVDTDGSESATACSEIRYIFSQLESYSPPEHKVVTKLVSSRHNTKCLIKYHLCLPFSCMLSKHC